MKDLIKRYLKIKIYSITSLRKEIKRLDDVTKQLYEITAGQQIIIDEYKDDSYKTKFKEEHKKRKEYEKEAKKIIDELTQALKEAQK